VTVYFIGAGPGAADLITVRGRDRIAAAPVCLYAGSLIPRDILTYAPAEARIIDTAEMTLDAIIGEIVTAHREGHDVARLHSGDISIWSAAAEQMRRLRELNIPYDITPGVPAFAAAAAALEQERRTHLVGRDQLLHGAEQVDAIRSRERLAIPADLRQDDVDVVAEAVQDMLDEPGVKQGDVRG